MAMRKIMNRRKVFVLSTDLSNYMHGRDAETREEETETPTYVKVSSVTGDKSQLEASVLFCDNESRRVYMMRTYSFVPSVADGSDNFIKQAYEYLKTLPEFDGAEDC